MTASFFSFARESYSAQILKLEDGSATLSESQARQNPRSTELWRGEMTDTSILIIPQHRFPVPFVELGQLPFGVMLKRISFWEKQLFLPVCSTEDISVSAMGTSLLEALPKAHGCSPSVSLSKAWQQSQWKCKRCLWELEDSSTCISRSTSIITDVLNAKYNSPHYMEEDLIYFNLS